MEGSTRIRDCFRVVVSIIELEQELWVEAPYSTSLLSVAPAAHNAVSSNRADRGSIVGMAHKAECYTALDGTLPPGRQYNISPPSSLVSLVFNTMSLVTSVERVLFVPPRTAIE